MPPKTKIYKTFPRKGWIKRILRTSPNMHIALARMKEALPPRVTRTLFFIEDARPWRRPKP